MRACLKVITASAFFAVGCSPVEGGIVDVIDETLLASCDMNQSSIYEVKTVHEAWIKVLQARMIYGKETFQISDIPMPALLSVPTEESNFITLEGIVDKDVDAGWHTLTFNTQNECDVIAVISTFSGSENSEEFIYKTTFKVK